MSDDPTPRLIVTHRPSRPEAVALVLHGGGARRGRMRVSPTQLSVLRMIPVAARLAHEGRGRLAVLRLLNSVRGWDTHHTPVRDVRWALERVREQLGPVPVALVGHSLGGRAALLAGSAPDVQSVVALAPWVTPEDAARTDLRGRDVLVVHGDEDRVANPVRALSLAESLRRTTDRVGYVQVTGGKHAMLRHHRLFDGLAAHFTAATLLGDRPHGPVEQVLGGRFLVEV